jgi:hypothetical protein
VGNHTCELNFQLGAFMSKKTNPQPLSNWHQRYVTLKPLNKREVARLTPGTFIRLKWMDGPDTAALLLEKMDRNERGEVSLHVFDGEEVSHHPVHNQVVAVLGHVDSMTFDDARSMVALSLD